MCNNCIHKIVCSKYIACGEVKSCEHHREERKGRWEDAHEIKSFRHTNIPVVKCSKCECYFCDIINNHHYMYHYCPNCGADMRGDSQ